MANKLIALSVAGLMAGEAFALGHISGFDEKVGNVRFYNYDEQQQAERVKEMELPSAAVFKLSAFAVARITGTQPITGRYFHNRPGPLDCDYKVGMQLPFVAEVVINLGDVSLSKTTTVENQQKVVANVTGNFQLFNPRVQLGKAKMDHDSDIGGCNPKSPAELINNMWRVGHAASATAAECLTAGLSGNAKAQEIQETYKAGLGEDIKALFPNADTIDVQLPANQQSDRPYAKRLDRVIAQTRESDDKITINAEPVKTCSFEKLEVETSVPPQ